MMRQDIHDVLSSNGEVYVRDVNSERRDTKREPQMIHKKTSLCEYTSRNLLIELLTTSYS